MGNIKYRYCAGKVKNLLASRHAHEGTKKNYDPSKRNNKLPYLFEFGLFSHIKKTTEIFPNPVINETKTDINYNNQSNVRPYLIFPRILFLKPLSFLSRDSQSASLSLSLFVFCSFPLKKDAPNFPPNNTWLYV